MSIKTNAKTDKKKTATKPLSKAQITHAAAVKKALEQSQRRVKKTVTTKKYFVTAAVQGATAHLKALGSIDTFLKAEGAELVILDMRAHLKALDDKTYPHDKVILQRYASRVFKQFSINDFLSAQDYSIRPTTSDPLAGLSERGANDGMSLVIAHVTQRMKTYPNAATRLPRLQQCTGSITEAFYPDSKAGELAAERHVLGGIIVEVVSRHRFHARAVQFDKVTGSFVDLGTRYFPANKIVRGERPEALIRGDDHVGFSNAQAIESVDFITANLKPKVVVFHDIFDAASVSHHRENSMIARLAVPEEISTLEKELAACTAFLKARHKFRPADCQFYSAASNHNEHLHKYLNEGRYFKDVRNFKKATELMHFWANEGQDPIIRGIDPQQQLATWLSRSDSVLRIESIVVSNHGDKGANGSRGGVKGDSTCFGNSVAGHSHSPEWFHGASRVGVLAGEMDYTVGSPSSWAHAVELIWKGGQRQMLFIINGKWRAEPSKTKAKAKGKKAA